MNVKSIIFNNKILQVLINMINGCWRDGHARRDEIFQRRDFKISRVLYTKGDYRKQKNVQRKRKQDDEIVRGDDHEDEIARRGDHRKMRLLARLHDKLTAYRSEKNSSLLKYTIILYNIAGYYILCILYSFTLK